MQMTSRGSSRHLSAGLFVLLSQSKIEVMEGDSSDDHGLQPGWKEDREEINEYSTLIFNPNKSLSIQEQRRRLPVYQHRDSILFLLESHQVLIIQGETGSGKSTQIPQYFMESGWTGMTAEGMKMIGVTQPSRVSAISLASRVASEVSCYLGEAVGYSVSLDEKWSRESTHIKYMTEGILIREMMSDPLLDKYSIIIMDEVHVRTINTDILLGLMKRILKKRKDIKLIVSSATLEAESLMKFFGQDKSTILCVSGTSHSIQVFYLKDPVANYIKSSVDIVITIHESPRSRSGDILVFLTGQDEVEEAVNLLIEYSRSVKNDANNKKLYILPLHASLPSREQYRVLQSFPRSIRKVIVSTNVAETSVTLPNIAYVIDSGFVKLKTFDPKTASHALVVVPVSQSNAKQRAGRAGRTNAGQVFRLYREEDYKSCSEFPSPEIQRSCMASVILTLLALGVGNINDFYFPDPPPQVNLLAGFELLFALQAIDEEGQLTELGVKMAEFPLQPSLSKILLESEKFSCSQEILTIVSMLMVDNVFQNPSSGQTSLQARNAKYSLSVEEGDLMTYLNIYNEFMEKGRSWADRNYLNYNALNRVTEIRRRLSYLMTNRFKMKIVSAEGDTESVLKCIVSGFFCNAVYLDPREGDRTYKTIRGDHCLYIHPTSVLNNLKKLPECLVFNEVLHTSQDFMRDLTAIESSWLYQLVPQYFQVTTKSEIKEKKHFSLF